jgi:RNA polymerase subunit RPABC4/transcription elongation factor Spt4
MAMVACKECGREISSTATSCPGCGASRARETFWQEHWPRFAVILFIVAVPFVIYWIGLRLG